MKNQTPLEIKLRCNSEAPIEVHMDILKQNYIVVPTSKVIFDKKAENYFVYVTIVPKQVETTK